MGKSHIPGFCDGKVPEKWIPAGVHFQGNNHVKESINEREENHRKSRGA